MRSDESSVVIDADVGTVWDVLVDIAGYVRWNSGFAQIDGTMQIGGELVYTPEGRTAAGPVTVTVTELVPRERIVWSRGTPVGLLRVVRIFDLAHLRDRARFTVTEVRSGVLWRVGATTDVQDELDRFAGGLKSRVEQGPDS